MQRIATLTAATLLLASGAAWAGCDYPDEPTTPNAAEMTLDEFKAAIAEFRQFQTGLEEYRKCLEDDFESLDEESKTEERKALVTSQHNSSIDREKQLAGLLNEQIRLWKKANEENDSKENDAQTKNDSADTANLWVFVTRNSSLDTIDVSVDPAFDIDPMDLSVRIKSGALSHEFGFLDAIYSDEGVVTSDAHFSPGVALASITGVSAAIGSVFDQRGLRCIQHDLSSSERLVFGCNFRAN